MTLIDAINDSHLFGGFFRNPESWKSWRVFIQALFGLPVEDPALFSLCTGGRPLPTAQSREAFLIVGRRGGKSYIAALVAVYLTTFRHYKLSPGERGIVMILASDKDQAKVIFGYCRAFIQGVDMLRPMVQRETATALEFSSGTAIEVHTSSFRSVRGRTLVAAVCDEVAFWRSDEAANPDIEVLNALRPAMATVPGAMLLAVSTPYSRRGVLWDAYRKRFGKTGDVIVWQADTLTMNPLASRSFIDSAYEDDPAAASAEYGALFRSDLEAFVSAEVVDAAIVPGRFEIPPVPGTRYHAFTDPAGGSGGDAFTLSVAHHECDHAVLDLIRDRKPPFSPEAVVQEFAADLKRYGIHEVSGDRYAGGFPPEQFQKHGIRYNPSDKPKSDLYATLLPMLNSGKLELLDNKVLRAQLVSLERRTARSGRDSIDHPVRGHDDTANAVAGALTMCAPTIELTANHFAQGVISFSRKPSEENSLWDQRPR
jgi:hypothetical protein